MVESPATSPDDPEGLLESLCNRLLVIMDNDPGAMTDADLQYEVEIAVAAGVAFLQDSESALQPMQRSSRPILVRDLWLSADLVLRSLQQRVFRGE